MGVEEEFAKALAKDPSLASRLKKTGELAEFKGRYNVQGASGLKCPVCAAFFQFPGSLWYSPHESAHFVCRKCHLEFVITCQTLPIPDIVSELKLIGKGKQAFPSWMKGNLPGGED